MESRVDAADSYFVQQQLTQFDPKTRYQLVPGVVGRKIMARVEGVSPNLPSYKYTTTKLQVSTRRSRGRGRDIPIGSVTKEEVVHTIQTFEHNASWTIDAVRAARESGSDLQMDTMVGAMTSIEQDIDSALAIGVPGTSVGGLMNNANIQATAAAGTWASASADAIIADVAKLITEAQDALKQAQVPGQNDVMFTQFSLYLPLVRYGKIDMTPRGSVNDTTILEFIKKFSALKAVIPWWRLDSISGSPKAVLVPALDNGVMNPLAGGALLPLDFERLPEQYRGRTVDVPCAGKCGGFACPYPVAFRYLTGL